MHPVTAVTAAPTPRLPASAVAAGDRFRLAADALEVLPEAMQVPTKMASAALDHASAGVGLLRTLGRDGHADPRVREATQAALEGSAVLASAKQDALWPALEAARGHYQDAAAALRG